MTTAGGTPHFMAPELLDPGKFGKTSSRPTQPADIYAFGMVIYEVLTGLYPFHDQQLGKYQVICRVVGGTRPTKPDNAEGVGFGNGTWELVKECWREGNKETNGRTGTCTLGTRFSVLGSSTATYGFQASGVENIQTVSPPLHYSASRKDLDVLHQAHTKPREETTSNH